MSELNKPAMPLPLGTGNMSEPSQSGGMTIRQHAAITLRVPQSGDPELDAMIREARRLDMANASLPEIIAQKDVHDGREWGSAAWIAFQQADAMLAASEPKKGEIETISELRSRISQKMDDCTKSVKRIDDLTVALEKARLHCLTSEWNPAVHGAIAVIEEALSASEPKKAEPEQLCVTCGKPTMHIGDECYGCCQAPKPDAEGWIEWKGWECPVPGETIVDVKKQMCSVHSVRARAFDWLCDGIIAYRVVK